MDERQVDISDMQCWLFRMAEKRWKKSSHECAELFRKYDVLSFIRDCYDILHLSGYECTLDDVETMLRNRGVAI